MTTVARPATARPAGAGHHNALNAIRLLLAGLVIVTHTGSAPWDGEGWIAGDTLGGWAVSGFFAISGYLVALSRSRTTLADYLRRRAVRIFPGYWFSLVVIAAVVAPKLASERNATRTSRPSPRPPIPWSGICRPGLWLTNSPATSSLGCSCPGRRALALWSSRQPCSDCARWSRCRGSNQPCPMRCSPWHGWARTSSRLTWLGALPIAFLVLWLGRSLPTRLGSTHDVSYGVYLYGFPAQQLLTAYGPWNQGAYFAAVLAMATGLAWISWLVIERPSMRWRRSLSATPQPPPRADQVGS